MSVTLIFMACCPFDLYLKNTCSPMVSGLNFGKIIFKVWKKNFRIRAWPDLLSSKKKLVALFFFLVLNKADYLALRNQPLSAQNEAVLSFNFDPPIYFTWYDEASGIQSEISRFETQCWQVLYVKLARCSLHLRFKMKPVLSYEIPIFFP